MRIVIKTLALALAIITAFSTMLLGGAYALSTAPVGEKNIISGDFLDNGLFRKTDDAPVAQTELQSKFYSMYELDGAENSVTVISEDFLYEYWESNYSSYNIHSLTTEEVLFIVHDSIRLYSEYDKVVLPVVGCVSSRSDVCERFPFIDGAVIIPVHYAQLSGIDYSVVISDINRIILYRIFALSSPDAFFTDTQAKVIYISGYSVGTDRDKVISDYEKNPNGENIEERTDLFCLGTKTNTPSSENAEWSANEIRLITKTGVESIYPTAEMLAEKERIEKDNEPSFENAVFVSVFDTQKGEYVLGRYSFSDKRGEQLLSLIGDLNRFEPADGESFGTVYRDARYRVEVQLRDEVTLHFAYGYYSVYGIGEDNMEYYVLPDEVKEELGADLNDLMEWYFRIND